MSYERVKGIKIENNQVFINSHSNNDTAESHYWKCESLTKTLQEKGELELDIEILKAYEEGEFQSSIKNKYTRALKVLYYVLKDEYRAFSWRNNGEDYNKAQELRKSEDFKKLLMKAFLTKLPKEKFIIHNLNNNGYVKKETSRHIFYCSEKETAKVYDFREQAERTANLTSLKGKCEVIQI